MRTRIRSLTLRAVALGVIALALTVGGATAGGARFDAAFADGVIKACRHKSGFLLVPSAGKTCKRSEQALSWNVGRAARPGGARRCRRQGRCARAGGRAGRARPSRRGRPRRAPPGPAGPPGPGGSIDAIEALDGIACTTSTDTSGEVSVETEVDGAIVLTCEDGRRPAASACGRRARAQRDRLRPGRRRQRRLRRDLQRRRQRRRSDRDVALVLVDGGTGGEYLRRALTGTLAAGAYLVVEVDAQNGAPDGVALIAADGALLDALSYEGAIEAATIGTPDLRPRRGHAPAGRDSRLEHRHRVARADPERQRHGRRGHRLGLHHDRHAGGRQCRLTERSRAGCGSASSPSSPSRSRPVPRARA